MKALQIEAFLADLHVVVEEFRLPPLFKRPSRHLSWLRMAILSDIATCVTIPYQDAGERKYSRQDRTRSTVSVETGSERSDVGFRQLSRNPVSPSVRMVTFL